MRSEAQLDRAKATAKLSGIPFIVLDENVETVNGNLSIGTMHSAKGLEFRADATMACDDEVIPLQERNEAVGEDSDMKEVDDTERQLLYGGCTRARDRLLVTAAEPASEFLNDITGVAGTRCREIPGLSAKIVSEALECFPERSRSHAHTEWSIRYVPPANPSPKARTSIVRQSLSARLKRIDWAVHAVQRRTVPSVAAGRSQIFVGLKDWLAGRLPAPPGMTPLFVPPQDRLIAAGYLNHPGVSSVWHVESTDCRRMACAGGPTSAHVE